MERRRSSGTITKSMYYSQKRILAFLLTAAMVFTNLGTGLNVSYAGTADQVTFQMKGADLVAAVEEAIESGHEITADDLGFTNGRTAEFEKVFFGTKGAVYEVYPEMEGSTLLPTPQNICIFYSDPCAHGYPLSVTPSYRTHSGLT